MGDVSKYKAKAESKSATLTEVKARGFNIMIDQPETWGGENQAATPVEYILAALAGCLNITGHLIAKKMEIAIDKLEFELEGELDYSDKDRSGFQEIRVKVKVDSSEDREKLEKWLEVVEKHCPVSGTISQQTPLKLNLQ